VAKDEGGQKTEKPTPRKLREARKKGQIPRSVDLVQWLTLLAACFLLPSTMERVIRTSGSDFQATFKMAATGEMGPTLAHVASSSGRATLGLAPLFIFVVVSSIIGMVAQGGVVLTADPIKPKWERISPKAGFKRVFGVASLVETGKAVARLAVLAILVATTLFAAGRDHLLASGMSLRVSTDLLVDQVVLLLRLAALIGSVIGLTDYAFQRWQTMKKLKMSKQEIKQEAKSSEGDPMIRSRRRQAHAKLTRNQMLSAVNGATVVVVNPTHFSVALAYGDDGAAPVVVAKGSDDLAFRIRDRARISEVPIVESPPLARALYSSVEVNDPIPESFFEAVAIVLAFVMRPRANKASATTRRVAIPNSKLPPAPALV
jgi:flagellar biosynthetic protein FlhB